MLAPSPDLPTVVFRDATADDIPELVAGGRRFFAESEFTEFAEFSPENYEKHLRVLMDLPTYRFILFTVDGKIEGMLSYALDVFYTSKPIALMGLFYVTPEHRRSPAGRLLLDLAIKRAKEDGATVFYAGSQAGIQSVAKTMPNLFRKFGFEETAFWGRKILTEDRE